MFTRGLQFVKFPSLYHFAKNVNKAYLQNTYNYGFVANYCAEAETIHKKIDEIVKSSKLVVFMKGTPVEPLCGFSNAVVRILEMHGIKDYDSVNVLEDEEIRNGVKKYSQWATIPQVFIGGEFVGGCDIMIELHKSGGLVEELNKAGFKSVLKDV